MRKKIFMLLKTLYKTYFIGQHEGQCEEPYLVLKFDNQNASSNDIAGWQYFEVMIYVPKDNIYLIDSIEKQVKGALTFVECTGNETPDFLDDDKQAYMRSIEFRIPKRI